MEKEQYLGVSVSPLTYQQIIQDIHQRIKEGKKSTIIAVNPEKVMAAIRDPQVKGLINESTFQIADGIGMLIASKLKGGNIEERVTGVDLMEHLLQFAAKENYGVFLYGAKEEVVVKAKKNIEERFPGIRITGYENGYIQDQDQLIKKINDSGATLLFVALGSPRQELWIKENKEKLKVDVFQGVGGSFDVFSGNVKRAPLFYRKLGMEWFYRLLKEPKRLKRQLALPSFLIKILLKRS